MALQWNNPEPPAEPDNEEFDDQWAPAGTVCENVYCGKFIRGAPGLAEYLNRKKVRVGRMGFCQCGDRNHAKDGGDRERWWMDK